jgi:hypothetical protein
MAGMAPTCVYQNITGLPSGLYTLSYIYSARTDFGLEHSPLGVYWNGFKVDSVHPNNYTMMTRTVAITQANDNETAQVKLCG